VVDVFQPKDKSFRGLAEGMTEVRLDHFRRLSSTTTTILSLLELDKVGKE